MSVEKNIADDTVSSVENSDAVQVNPELTKEENQETEVSTELNEIQDESSDIEAEGISDDLEEEALKTEPAEEPAANNSDSIEPVAEVTATVEDTSVNSALENETTEQDEVSDESNSVPAEVTENTETVEDATKAIPDLENKEIEVSNGSIEEVAQEKEALPEVIIDYSTQNKEQLLQHISDIAQNFNLKKAGEPTNEIRDTFNAIISEEENAARTKFIAEGGTKEDFKFFSGNEKMRFDEHYKLIKEKRHHHYKNLEKEKDGNLKLKNDLLERLRQVVDNEESTSINLLKKLQEEWKSIGPVHQQHNKTLWANYNALLDRFYDHRSIYFELKDLDRKKNLEAKIELCEKAESLDKEEQLNVAIKKLNDLHEEFKHLGPVPREEQENLWIRFKTASDIVYSKRKEHTAELIEQLKANLAVKLELLEELNELTSFDSEKIGEWNAKTKEVLELQKKWESIGGMPREHSKDINKKFWGNFKQFFNNKNKFFKSLDSQREANLEIKQALLDKAEALQDNQEWDKTSNELVKLQNDWKNSGPVPEKHRNAIYKKFKAACDAFFNNRRTHNKDIEADYSDNLSKKAAICEQLETMGSDSSLDAEKVYQLQDGFNSIGFVPRNSIKKIQNRYKKALQTLLDNVSNLSESDFDIFKAAIMVNDVRSGPDADKKIQRQEHALKRKITNLEGDISTWKNNLGFFANSKNAADLLKDFEQKIIDAEASVVKLKAELKIFQSA
jgi:hypothetical protein